MKKNNRKKGQITIFIIIGILLLIAIGFLVYFKVSKSENTLSLSYKKPSIPDTLIPVNNYVTSCLQDVATQAVVELGKHGGYIALNDPELSQQNFILNQQQPTQADAVSFSQEHHIPYWQYLEGEVSCVQCPLSFAKIPSIEEMTHQIQNYVTREFSKCVNDFSDFKNQGFEIASTGVKSSEVLITQDDVQVKITYPLTVSKDDTSLKLDEFYTTVDVPLLKMYTLAEELLVYFANNQTLETITMSLVTLYSGLDANKLPPMFDSNEGYDQVMWSMQNSKQLFSDILTANIPLISFKNTENDVHITSEEFNPYQQGVYNLLYQDIFDKQQPFKVSVLYLDYPVYFDITPHQGDLLQPQVEVYHFFADLIPALQVNNYDFQYDIAYPVVIQLRDQKALAGKGYDFMFSYEINIRDNRNMKTWYEGLGTIGQHNPTTVGFTPLEGKVETDAPDALSFNLETNTTSNLTYQPTAASLFCNPNQRDSGEISVSVTDSLSKNDLDNAAVFYSCGSYGKCALGTTKQGSFTGKFPLCQGGVLSLKKQGYETKLVPLSTSSEKSDVISVSLFKLPSLKVNIKKIPLLLIKGITNPKGSQSFLHQNAKDLSAQEKVILTLRKVSTSVIESSEFISYDSSSGEALYLMPGEYTLTATIYDEQGTIIKPDPVSFDDKTLVGKDIILKPLVIGGLLIDQTTGYWEITQEKLASAQEITLYLIAYPKPTTTADLAEINNLGIYSQKYHDVFIPKIN